MLTDEVRIRHMLDATQKAIVYSNGLSRDTLQIDELRTLALVRLLEILGEAAKNISQPTKDLAPSIPWRQIAATRDRLIHGYFAIDLDILWAIIENDLPPLSTELQSLLSALSSD